MLKLPRILEKDPRKNAILQLFSRDLGPLWDQSPLRLPHIDLTAELEQALLKARLAGHLQQGLEHAQEVLESEQRGLEALRRRQGTLPAQRLSRIALITQDGSSRFYRDFEKLLQRYQERLAAFVVRTDGQLFASKFFGTDRQVRLILVDERDWVIEVLTALVTPQEPQTKP